MGLDFSHCEAHWAYSGFHRFRTRIAKEIGIVLGNMKGFGGEFSWGEITDPIKPLLDHSDCDGELTPEECSMVVPRLKSLIELWNDDDYDKQQALKLIKGMELCIKNNESLEFC